VSTATVVPETRGLSGEDAWTTLRRTGRRRLLTDALARMRYSDGFSHARSLAFLTALVAVEGLIAVVGLAHAAGGTGFSSVVSATVRGAVPGPAGESLTAAMLHAQSNGSDHRYAGLVVGTVGTLLTATTAFGQLERALNRLYGIEEDRPPLAKYGRALVLAVTLGTVATLAFVSLALGRDLLIGVAGAGWSTVWNAVRWPLGLGLAGSAMTALLKLCPRRRQPHLSWLAFGSGVAVLGWVTVTGALGLFFRVSHEFGQTYGPLAGMVALLLWAALSSTALIYGAAVAAQLEAVRCGGRTPQDDGKVAASEPEEEEGRVPEAVTS
jgi:YihY family inner membrane protein